MSIVIVGGNECMESQYKQICKSYGCRAKIFTKMPSNFKRQLGFPDLIILFTNTVSHKMVGSALQEAGRRNTRVARCHSSSSCALKEFYRARQDAFFAFDDHENCRRIFEDALEYQRKR